MVGHLSLSLVCPLKETPLHFNGHFPDGSGTRTSPFWMFFGAKDDGGGDDK